MKMKKSALLCSALLCSALLIASVPAVAQTPIELFKSNSTPVDGKQAMQFINDYNNAGFSGINSGPFSFPMTTAANILKLRDHLLKTQDMAAGIAAENRERHERAMAVQGATANLFQPYQVGKANVTAALGGYRGEHAVAVGTGYRFNENIAVRASAAFNFGNSNPVYGVGMNVEW